MISLYAGMRFGAICIPKGHRQELDRRLGSQFQLSDRVNPG